MCFKFFFFIFKDVQRGFEGSSKVFLGSFKGVSLKFQWRVACQGRLKAVFRDL